MPNVVSFTTAGITSITGVPPIYNDKYVLQKTDFGFFHLDTVAYTAGMVQVQSKCGVGLAAPATGLYVIGDCNGITNISTSGTSVLARQLSGQCGACQTGCPGPREDGHYNFLFTLGTWAFVGWDQPDIPDSTQTADLSGRTWQAFPDTSNLDGKHFYWQMMSDTGGGPPPPLPPPAPLPGVVESVLVGAGDDPMPGSVMRADFLLLQDTPPLHAVGIYFVSISQTGTRRADITLSPTLVFPQGIFPGSTHL